MNVPLPGTTPVHLTRAEIELLRYTLMVYCGSKKNQDHMRAEYGMTFAETKLWEASKIFNVPLPEETQPKHEPGLPDDTKVETVHMTRTPIEPLHMGDTDPWQWFDSPKNDGID